MSPVEVNPFAAIRKWLLVEKVGFGIHIDFHYSRMAWVVATSVVCGLVLLPYGGIGIAAAGNAFGIGMWAIGALAGAVGALFAVSHARRKP